MMDARHPFRSGLAIALVAAGLLLCARSLPSNAQAQGGGKKAKTARPNVALLTGGAPEDLKVLRETLKKVPAIKFNAEEIKFADFGRDGGTFTSFFLIEMTDLNQTDVGAIARAVGAANTSKKEKCPSALFLIFKYKPDSVKTEPFRALLAKVKGVQPAKSWAGDSNLWVSLDDSGQGKLAEITRAMHGASIKFRDPILDQ